MLAVLLSTVLPGCKSQSANDSFRDDFSGWGQNLRPRSKASAGPSLGLSSRSREIERDLGFN